MTPAEVVIDVFGGVRATARVVNVNASTVCRWLQPRTRGGTGGIVPETHHATLLEAAQATGKLLSQQALTIGRPTVIRRVIHRI